MKTSLTAFALAAFVASLSAPALADALPPTPVAAAAAQAYVAATLFPAPAKLTVTSSGFADGGDIPFEYTGWRDNRFPGLSWSKGPAGTKSYVTVVQDADGLLGGTDAILHWTLYDIPADVTALPPGMTDPPRGSERGPNRNGPAAGYLGPRTGAGAKHRYPFQVFALDTVIAPSAALSWPQLKAAMAGHVLAAGQTIGLGQLDPTAQPNAPPPGAPPK